MPKTKLQAKFCPDPPIDWLRAACLERRVALGYNLTELSKVAGVSYDYMRHLWAKSPWDWPAGVRGRICTKLGIKPIQGVEGSPLWE